jgi:hypothetical protein
MKLKSKRNLMLGILFGLSIWGLAWAVGTIGSIDVATSPLLIVIVLVSIVSFFMLVITGVSLWVRIWNSQD